MFTPAHRGGSGPPLVLVHGFTDTWRTWEPALPALERRHDVLAPTLPGHAGGPPLPPGLTPATMAGAVERAMDEAGFATAHVAGNSLGGYVALQLAERGRAESVTAFAPAGGWAPGDERFAGLLRSYTAMQAQARAAAPHAHAIAATPEGRRRATQYIATDGERLQPDLVAHLIAGVASCAPVAPMVRVALEAGYPLDAERIDCPVRIAWGTNDRLLPWPEAAVRYRAHLPHADWVELEGSGHCPQLDAPLETAQLVLGLSSP